MGFLLLRFIYPFAVWNNGKRLFNFYNLEYKPGDFLHWVGGGSKRGILLDEGTWEEEEEAIDI
ncbi:hypothetical protein HOY82DRAFT_112947 [Tuber indicum]|nr:hypothetical protein HOY82DRAFT_112947 [Tuber indicum]